MTKDRDYTILFPDKAKHLDFKKLDSSVKNKFCLKWLQKVAYVGERRYRFKDCLQKVTLPGQALRVWCDNLVNYGSSGAKSLDSHMRTLKHMDSAVDVLGEAKAGLGDAGLSDEVDQPVYSIQLGRPAVVNDSTDTTGMCVCVILHVVCDCAYVCVCNVCVCACKRVCVVCAPL